uniref:Uncharacterized protein n=1 Tax=Zea mays TaxID=4577 RepID=C0PD29_MAIZE|nr:unknown [Zea mays]ACN36250.1 unknown [Zea mays]
MFHHVLFVLLSATFVLAFGEGSCLGSQRGSCCSASSSWRSSNVAAKASQETINSMKRSIEENNLLHQLLSFNRGQVPPS